MFRAKQISFNYQKLHLRFLWPSSRIPTLPLVRDAFIVMYDHFILVTTLYTCFLCQQIVKCSLRKHATDNTGQNSKEMLRRALCNGYFCNVARKWECFLFSKIITSFFFLHMYIATHFNLNLYAPISTYKFSKLVSIHFLIELIDWICSKFKRRPEICHFTAT